MPAPPLTHHEIVALAEPFVRRGHAVDLAASRRDERRIVFAPAADRAPAGDGVTDTLVLDVFDGGRLRLTRLRRDAAGAAGSVRAAGRDAAALLAAVEAVAAERLLAHGDGWTVARDYAFASLGAGAAPVLAQGRVHAGGGTGGPALTLTMNVPAARGVSATLVLEPARGERLALPEDLLAVLGWGWARLVPARHGWTSRMRLRGTPARRTQRAEAALDAAALHLARTLAEPPAEYHERWRAQRYGVFVRRGIPSATALALVGGTLLAGRVLPELPTAAWVALYHVPTLLLAAAFMLQELPRFEIPPWPRARRTPGWRVEPAALARAAVR